MLAKRQQRALDVLHGDCGYPGRLDRLDVDDHNRSAIAELKDYGAGRDCWYLDRDGGYRTLWIWGPCGTGKTTLATAVAHAHAQTVVPYTVRFVIVRELLRTARGAITRNDPIDPIDAVLADPIDGPDDDVSLLVLDDLGAERPTEWARETIAHIVERRYTHGLGTIVTSNYSPSGLIKRLAGTDHADPIAAQRIVSRLREDCLVIKLDGPDRRITDAQLQVVA